MHNNLFNELMFNNFQIMEIDSSQVPLLNNLFLPSTGGGMECIGGLLDVNFFILHASAIPQDAPVTLAMEKAYSLIKGIDLLLQFNELYELLLTEGIGVYGISTQSTYLQEITSKALSLKFSLISDRYAEIAKAIKIPLLPAGRIPRYPPTIVISNKNHAILIELIKGFNGC